jgi:hypothetical protein
MPATPQITLTANLESILAGAETSGWLQITLCGFGPVMPSVPGTGMLADAGIPQLAGPQVGSTPISQLLYGNDVISPAGTFYSVAVMDSQQNVVQTGNYIFSGSGSQDLSNAIQIVPPYGYLPGFLSVQRLDGDVPGTVYTAPGPIVAVFYNGALMRPTIDYTLAGNVVTLRFSTEVLDNVYALCIVSA